MSSLVKNMKVSKQVGVLAVLSMIGFAVVAAIYWTSAQRLSDIQHDTENLASAVQEIEGIKYQFLNSRRAEKDFIIRLHPKYIKKHDGIIAKANEGIESVRGRLSAARGEQLDGISAGLATYQAQFKKVSDLWIKAGLNEKEGLHGSLRKSVKSVEGDLKKQKDAAGFDGLMVTMLMMRRHEKDFLARIKDKYIGRMDKRLAEFSAALPASGISEDVQKVITGKMKAYHKDFKAVAEVRLQLIPETKKLSKLFAKFAPVMAALEEELVKEFDQSVVALESTTQSTLTMIVGAIIAVSAVVLVMTVVIGKAISSPLVSLTSAMEAVAAGKLDTEVSYQENQNEIGAMARTLGVFQQSLKETEELRQQQEEDQKRRAARTQKIEAVVQQFDTKVGGALGSMVAAVGQLHNSADEMNNTATSTTQQSETAAQASENAAQNVQAVSAAAEELSSSIAEISRQVAQSTEIASGAVIEAESTNKEVLGLAEAVNRIGEVVNLINDIAEQTNLLALNATIEAARAGDAGKGFAVVASEVKNLANQTAKATDEITGQITEIQTSTDKAVGAIGGITGTISHISEIASAIAAAVEEQGAATQEIARNAEETSQATGQMLSNVQGLSAAASTTGAVAGQVSSASTQLSGEAESLRETVDGFLTEIRAA